MSRQKNQSMRLGVFVFGALAMMVLSSRISATPAPSAGGFSGVWYEITAGSGSAPNKYGGGLATYPQQHSPIAIYSPEAQKTFFVYGGARPDNGRLQHMISYYDHQTGLLARPRVWLDDNNTNDAHDNPTMAIDSQGYVYMFSNVHGDNRRSYIRRSINPYSISDFAGLLSANSPADIKVFGATPRFSYGQPWYLPQSQQFVLLHTKYDEGDRNLYATRSSDADVWEIPNSVAGIERGQYQVSWIKPDGQTIGTAFDIHPNNSVNGSGSDARTNLYYMETPDAAVSWRTVQGLTITTPISSAANPALIKDYRSEGKNVYIKDLNYDAQGRPVILYLTSGGAAPGPVNAPYTVHTAAYDGNEWQIRDVLTTDHNYDHGSLHITEGAGGSELWRMVGTFIDGPQTDATGGEIGMWVSTDRGQTWSINQVLTQNSVNNHSYPRRPLNAHEDFFAFWADGNALAPSDSSLYFANSSGEVFKMPTEFQPDQMFAAPIRLSIIPEPSSFVSLSVGLAVLAAGTRCRDLKPLR